MKRLFFLGIIAIILSVLFIGCGQDTDDLYKAGTYIATEKGKYDGLKLSVTFNSNEITVIEILDHNESIADGSYRQVDAVRSAISDLPTEIKEAQSTTVDKVAGATLTSEGIINAVNDAITQAKDALK